MSDAGSSRADLWREWPFASDYGIQSFRARVRCSEFAVIERSPVVARRTGLFTRRRWTSAAGVRGRIDSVALGRLGGATTGVSAVTLAGGTSVSPSGGGVLVFVNGG